MNYSKRLERFLLFVFFVLYVFLFGTREASIGADTSNYLSIYVDINKYGLHRGNDIGFYYLVKISSFLGKRFYLLLCAILYLGPLIFVFSRKGGILLFFSFVSFFFFQSMGINILRHGIALSFMILALYYSESKFKFWFFAIVSLSFHFATIIVLILMLIQKYIKLKISLVLLGISIIISFLGQNVLSYAKQISFINNFYNERMVSYIEGTTDLYKVGFRFDFLLFNLLFLFLFLFLYKKIYNYKNSEYNSVLNLYVLTTSVFVLSFHIPYSDRVGLMSWVFIPYLMLPMSYNKNFRSVFLIVSILIFVIFI